MKVSDLKERLARDGYAVDHDAVAEALIARMRAVHAALRRADVRALLGDDLDGLAPPAGADQKSCS